MYMVSKFRLYSDNNQLELINKFFWCNSKYMSVTTCIKDYVSKFKLYWKIIKRVQRELIKKKKGSKSYLKCKKNKESNWRYIKKSFVILV